MLKAVIENKNIRIGLAQKLLPRMVSVLADANRFSVQLRHHVGFVARRRYRGRRKVQSIRRWPQEYWRGGAKPRLKRIRWFPFLRQILPARLEALKATGVGID